MKRIVFTQRVEVIEGYDERRDCADQNIARLIDACGYLPIPIMNVPELVNEFCCNLHPDGFLLTGGNDLFAYGGNAPERDETERELIEYAEKNNTPLFGICRGMQMIASYYGTNLERVEGHVRRKHSVKGIINRNMVNSFHGMGLTMVKKPLVEVARSEDGVVEAIMHSDFMIAGVMWHPERVQGFSSDDVSMLQRFFTKGRVE